MYPLFLILLDVISPIAAAGRFLRDCWPWLLAALVLFAALIVILIRVINKKKGKK